MADLQVDIFDITDTYPYSQNNHKKFTGCKGGQAAAYHGKGTGNQIKFANAAQYYAFGYRDGGKATRITMTCEGKSVGVAQDRYVENNVCKSCPKGFSCANGKKVELKISSVMLWNTGVKTHDHDLSKPFSQFTTNGASLLDKNTGTGIDVVSNLFWSVLAFLDTACIHTPPYRCSSIITQNIPKSFFSNT